MNGVAEIIGGVKDHVHLLVGLRPAHCLADVMRELKKDSTNWVKENLERRFAWQEGYAAFTVSPSATGAVQHYIANQEVHHARHSCVDELKELLGKAGVVYEKKYLYRILHPSGCGILFTPDPVVCDHRLLSRNPSGCVDHRLLSDNPKGWIPSADADGTDSTLTS
jgi:putative transposase